MVTCLDLNEHLPTVSTFSSYGFVVSLDIVFTSENIKEIKKHHQTSAQTRKEKGCRDGMTKNDTNKGGFKSEGKIYKAPSLHLSHTKMQL